MNAIHRPRPGTTPDAAFASSATDGKNIPFATALEATVRWYRDNESWWGPIKDEIESTYARRGQ